MANEIKALNIGGTTYDIKPEFADNAGKVNSPLKAGTKSYNGSAEVTITAADLGLSSALKYIGTSSTKVSDGGTESPTINDSVYSIPDGTSGQVVFYDKKEFVWNGSTWEFLGDNRNFKVIQSPVSDPIADDATSTTFIDAISQDANGLITATKKRLPSYLSTSGGTISGSGFWPLKVKSTGQDAVGIGFEGADGRNGYLLYTGDSTYKVTDNGWNNLYTLLHSGNIGEHALPLSGGTMALGSGIYSPLDLVYGAIGFNADHNAFGSPNVPTKIRSIVTPVYFNGVVEYTLIHSGNIGSYKAGDSALFDGRTSGGYYLSQKDVIPNGDLANLGAGSYYAASAKGDINPLPIDYCSLSVLGRSYYSQQLCMRHNATRAWLRGIYNTSSGVSATEWHELAFTDSNVASATKLATARTIWGQSFDGTGNVSGDIVGGTKLFAIYGYDDNGNTNIIDCSGINKNLWIGYGSAAKSYNTELAGNNIYFHHGTSRSIGMVLNTSGNVGIGTTDPQYKLDVNGTARINDNTTIIGTCSASSGFFETSDSRLKDFKDPVKVDLDKLSKLTKAYFTFKNDPEKMHLGVSAQEIQEIYPEIVNENEEGFLSVDYAKLSVVALAAVDELNNRLNSIEERLARLEK